MANQDYLTINGSHINLTTWDAAIDRCTPYTRGGMPTLQFSRVIGTLTALPDAWSGQSVSWSNGSSYPGTTYFSGDVVGYSDRYEQEVGWIRDYRALGLRNRADWIPVTDDNTFSDSASYNLPVNDPNCVESRLGRTMGQCVLDLLSMPDNVAALTAYGIGAFSSAGSGGAGTAVLGGTRGWQVSSITVAGPGTGYTVAPTVVISGACTTQAVYTANVSAGQITSFSQVNAGAGYLAPPTVIISTLPAVTITDLAALTVIPPFRVDFAGERILASIESVVQTCHPNHWLHVVGDTIGSDVVGTIRLMDQRAFTSNTVTLGVPGSTPETDGTYGSRWLMPSLHRDLADCYSQLIVRGGLCTGSTTLAVKQWPGSSFTSTWSPSGSGSIANGGLLPWFSGWGGYTTNAAAEAAWSPSMFATLSLQAGQDQGSCTCPSTTSVVITSQNTALTLASDQLDQTNTGLHAQLTVFADVISGVQQSFTVRVTANTAMTAGGTSTLSLDRALPSTSYNSYRLTMSSSGGNVVWRRYKVMNATVAAAMQQVFPYPFAFRNSDGTAAAMTSAPVCTVYWSASGNPPYNQSTIGVQIDPVAGTITTVSPTSLVYGGGVVTPPTDVQVFLPIATGELSVQYPTSGYAGTLYTVEGIQRTKTITVRAWTDYSLNANMAAYAYEQFTSFCNVVVEGSISYLGLPTTYLAPGQAISITGNSYTTGYESVTLPVASIDIQFNPGPAGTTYVSTMNLSNRQARFSADVFVRPAISGQQFGGAAWAADAFASLQTFLADTIGSPPEGLTSTAYIDSARPGAANQAASLAQPTEQPGPAMGGFGSELAGGVGQAFSQDLSPAADQEEPIPLLQPAAEPQQAPPPVIPMPTHPEAGLGH
jgi:hypothetical protein